MISMGYLICDQCKGYYELKEGESPGDFDCCQCGGKLNYVDKLDKHSAEEKKLEISGTVQRVAGIFIGALIMITAFYINSPDTTSASFVYNSNLSFYIWFIGGVVAALIGGGNIKSSVGNGFYAAALSGVLVIVMFYDLANNTFTGPTFGDNAALFAGLFLIYALVPAVFSMLGGLVAGLARSSWGRVIR